MVTVQLSDCLEFLAGDHTRLRELIHPGKQDLKLGYSLAHGRLAPGKRSKWHRLASSEVYYFLAGRGEFSIDRENQPVCEGSIVYVPPQATQSLSNTGTEDIEFLCLVDPAWKPEDEEICE
ncbi:MAG: cupin domain-containing protein [Nitrospiraceae bacterium]